MKIETELQLKQLRNKAGYSQQVMADKLGITIRRYGSWEREENNFTLNDAIKIADVLDCTLDELAGYVPVETAPINIEVTPATNTAYNDLAKLFELKRRGALTEEEYQEKKNALIELM